MTALRCLTLIAVAAALYFGSAVFIPLISSYFLYVLLDPVVIWCSKHRISRTVSSLILVGFSVVVAGLVVWSLYGAFANIAREVPTYSHKIKNMISGVEKKAESLEESTSTIVPKNQPAEDIQKVQVVEGYGPLTSFAFKGINTVFDVFTYAFFIPLLALFFLIDKPDLTRTLDAVTPRTWNTKKMGSDLAQMIRGYFVGNVVIGLGMALLLTILFLSFGINNAIPLGLAAGFLNLIPFLGPVVSLILPLAAGLLQFNTVAPFVIIAVTVLTLHLIVTNIIVPKVVGSHISINALAATVGLLFWGWLWGAIGLLLAIPITAMIKIVLENNSETELLSHFFSERAHARKKSRLRQFFTRRVESP